MNLDIFSYEQDKLFLIFNSDTKLQNRGSLISRITQKNFEVDNQFIMMSEDDKKNLKIEKKMQKYFFQRYFFFSKYDEGIQMDDECWYSVVPEQIGQYVAQKLQKFDTILDGFAGSGGFSIQLAKNIEGVSVISNDIDKEKTAIQKNNAKVYECLDSIIFLTKDFLELNESVSQIECVVLCPPWGGKSYNQDNIFLLDEQITPPLSKIIEKALKFSKNFIIQLPKNFILQELVDIVWKCYQNSNDQDKFTNLSMDIEIIRVNDRIDQVFVYFGECSGIKLKSQMKFIARQLEIEEQEEKDQLMERIKNGEAVDIFKILGQTLNPTNQSENADDQNSQEQQENKDEKESETDDYYKNMKKANLDWEKHKLKNLAQINDNQAGQKNSKKRKRRKKSQKQIHENEQTNDKKVK